MSEDAAEDSWAWTTTMLNEPLANAQREDIRLQNVLEGHGLFRVTNLALVWLCNFPAMWL
jgi:hypothetical protein